MSAQCKVGGSDSLRSVSKIKITAILMEATEKFILVILFSLSLGTLRSVSFMFRGRTGSICWSCAYLTLLSKLMVKDD